MKGQAEVGIDVLVLEAFPVAAELRSAWTGEGARPHTSSYAAPNRTDTSFEIPGSCMVTP